MTNDEKRALMQKVSQDLMVVGMLHGDRNPLIAVEIVDTDPEPMSKPYLQASVSFKFPLE